jgi:hypothetical protein
LNKKTVKIIVSIISFIIIASGLFVTADYFELFGTTVEKRLDFAEIRFRTLDKDTGGIVMNAGVRCFQKTNMNSCTLKDSHRVGVVSVNVPIQRAVKKTILFKKAEEIFKSIDPEINIMIIHNDYHNPTVKLAMEDLYSSNVIEQTIEMTPRDWGNSDSEFEHEEEMEDED